MSRSRPISRVLQRQQALFVDQVEHLTFEIPELRGGQDCVAARAGKRHRQLEADAPSLVTRLYATFSGRDLYPANSVSISLVANRAVMSCRSREGSTSTRSNPLTRGSDPSRNSAS